MKSAKQRRAEIKSAREQRKAARLRAAIKQKQALRPLMTVMKNFSHRTIATAPRISS
jgi:hypothetical protein